jgi:hypothetical protein
VALTLVYPFSVTIPANTPKAAPVVVPTVFEPNIVNRVEWLFPQGCAGMVGIQIGARSVPVIPSNRALFLTRTGDSSGFDTEDMHDSGDWSVIGYNTGLFPHTIQVTFRAHRKPRPVQLGLWTETDWHTMLGVV